VEPFRNEPQLALRSFPNQIPDFHVEIFKIYLDIFQTNTKLLLHNPKIFPENNHSLIIGSPRTKPQIALKSFPNQIHNFSIHIVKITFN